MKDYYAILGLDSDASRESIKIAYRRLALENHPDRVIHLDKEAQQQASGRMAELNEAYSVLSDSRQRREYDAKYVTAAAPPAEEGGPSVSQAIDEALKAAAPPVTRPQTRPDAAVLSNVVRQFSQQTRKDLLNQKSLSWKEQRFEGFEWALNASFWLASYWVAVRGFAVADRAAVQKFTNYANLAIESNKSYLRSNYFLLLFPFQKLNDGEYVVSQCQRLTQAGGKPTLQGTRTVIVLWDVTRDANRVYGPKVQDKLFLHLVQTLRLSRT